MLAKCGTDTAAGMSERVDACTSVSAAYLGETEACAAAHQELYILSVASNDL